MNAIAKMDAYGLKGLAEAVGRDLVTLYRWRKALMTGRGISTPNQRQLITATAGTEHAILWTDFIPDEGRPATAGEPAEVSR